MFLGRMSLDACCHFPSILQPRPKGLVGLSYNSGFPVSSELLMLSGDSGLPYRPSGLLIESGSNGFALSFPR
jgi:hypothetical protein